MSGILALDLGEKRIGMAINLVGTVITSLPTLTVQSTAGAVEATGLIVHDRSISTIVLGTPRPGSPLEEFVQQLADRLADVDIVQLDETLTTKEAERLAGPAADTDAVAARLLLEQYLATREQV